MRSLFIVVITATALAASPLVAAAPTVKAGIEAWQKADYARAVAIWRPLAKAGNADAAFNLGQAYRLGRGVPLDLSAAQTWLLRAASKDHLDAQATLGLLLFDSGDMKGAMRWLKAAAQRGDPRAQLIYGTALFNGDGLPRDPLLGYAFVSRSAAQGLGPAKDTLAQLDKVLPADQRKKGAALAIAATKANRVEPKAPAAVAPPRAIASAPAAASPIQGGWRIQLGAFSKRSSAEALFKRWSSTLAGKQPSFPAAGAVTRLQVGPYATKAAAAAACASLTSRGQACFPVPGR